jgi:hypothetical protein
MASIAKTCVHSKAGHHIRPSTRAIQMLVLGGLATFAKDLAAQGFSNADREPSTIHGVVLNRITREPISRALVYSPDNLYAALTDDRGRFQFTFPAQEADPVGNLGFRTDSPAPAAPLLRAWLSTRPNYFMVRKPGYLVSTESAQQILSDSPQSDLTLFLDPEGLIIGHVRFSTVDNADRIQVELLRREFYEGHERWVFASSFTTWSDGEFRFYELVPGTYKLISHEQLDRDSASFNPHGQVFGYRPGFYPDSPDFDSASPIQIKAGTVFQASLVPVRSEYYPVKIAVYNAPVGAPVNVFVYPKGHAGPGYSLGYNWDEQRLEGMLPNGRYTVRVSTRGENSSTGVLDFAIQGAPHEGSVVRLTPNVSVAINVKEEFGKDDNPNQEPSDRQIGAVEGGHAMVRRSWNVSLIPADAYGVDQVDLRPVDGAEGFSYVINAVAPGNYWVRVHSERGYPASVIRGGVDLLHHQLVVGAGESSLPIEVTLRDDGAEVSGTVQSSPSNRNPSRDSQFYSAAAYIYFVPVGEGAGQFRQAMASPGGSFQTLEQLPPGIYRVLAFSRPQEGLESADPDSLRTLESKGLLVQLNPGQKKPLSSPLLLVGE